MCTVARKCWPDTSTSPFTGLLIRDVYTHLRISFSSSYEAQCCHHWSSVCSKLAPLLTERDRQVKTTCELCLQYSSDKGERSE